MIIRDCIMYRLSAQLQIVVENHHFKCGPALGWIPVQFTIGNPIVHVVNTREIPLVLVYLPFWEEVHMKNYRSPRLFGVERAVDT